MRWLAVCLLLWVGAAQAQPITGLGMISPWSSARVTDDQTYTANTTLADVPGLTVNLQAGHTYGFTVDLSYTDTFAGNNGGIQLAMGGTVIATNIIYDGWLIELNSVLGQGQAYTLGGVVANGATNSSVGHASIVGTITVDPAGAGTLTVQAAQWSSNAIPTVVKQGSRLLVIDMP